MAYTWNQLHFDLPADLIDQTIVTLVDDADAPTFTVTLATDKRTPSLAFGAYVEAQLVDLARSLPGYSSLTRTESPGRVVVEHRARSPQGQGMRQKQAYVDLPLPAGSAAILTVTCVDKAHKKADEAFDNILRTLGA